MERRWCGCRRSAATAALLLALVLSLARCHAKGMYTALCVIGRDENRYVKEWVDYYKCLGG